MDITEIIDGHQVTRPMTPEEEAAVKAELASIGAPEPTIEDQLADLTELVAILAEVIAND